ncbi:lipase [Rhodopirellula maiorica SM1]|uniref:Lipase n=1 Tax=Rhodopirellula maiorica SM1 TaxID=1265738 RepID=M5R9S2_9BACT|nr:alpha/beta hydrolase family protein [Rhodopirellula maiorica]EMI16243.1 lipase [Rhodopirellula maiorica SM1]
MRIFCLLALLFLSQESNLVRSQSPTDPLVPKTSTDDETSVTQSSSLAFLNKTAGGTQVWTDHAWVDGNRIQQNALTGHWRLLDPNNNRITWGTRQQCETRLAAQTQASPAPHCERVVILLHGLMRTHHSMMQLEKDLKASDDAEIIRFSYASTRCSIGDHAAALRELLERLPEDTKISFVGHSMGNIVTRHLIGDLQRDGDPKNLLPRCESMVMLGPPNQGAAIARRINAAGIFDVITGKGCRELGSEWQAFADRLATPPFPFAIVAGDVSTTPIQNPLVDGASDFVVSIEEAQLEGAEEFHTVPALHSFLMNNEQARELTIDFLISHRTQS